MSTIVQIKDNLTAQILYECSIAEIETAYNKATEYEAMGLDISLIAPGLTETLISSLGASSEEILKYKEGLDQEISDHNIEFGDEWGCSICSFPSK
jgi:hypothetical protein